MMKRIRKWVTGLSIRKKLVFYSYLFVTPILLLICCLLCYRNYVTAVEREENACISDVKRLSDSIVEIQRNIIEMGTYISINNEITQILKSNEPEKLNADAQIWMHQAPMQIIQDMVALDGYIKTIALYPENGVIPYLRCIDYSAYIGDIEEVREQDIYKLAAQETGKFLWQRIGKYESDTYQFNRNDKIVMYRVIYDLARQKRLGYLVIGASAEVFDSMCQNALNNADESIVIISEYGAELLRCGTIGQEVISGIMDQNLVQSIGNDDVGISEYENYKVYFCKDMEIGTITYKIVPKVSLYDFVDTIILTPLALLLGFLIGLYPVMILLSNVITKPLHNLSQAMERFKNGDFTQKIEVQTRDEVGEVTSCFNSMVDDIRDLIDKNYVLALKEKESELDILQAQMNPHFLYNTLDSLYWKAIESDNEEIGEDILSLSQLFRFVLSRGNGIVPVRLEMELIDRYLYIQKIRFGKRLEYVIEFEESILEEEIPKLILQPFVENAIVHGFEKGTDDYLLTISGKREGNYMTFSIIDSGVGMSKEQLQAIWVKSESRQYASQRIGRYAIKNVKERLELIYKEDYTLLVESKEGHGTTVKITVPCGMKEIRSNE